MASEERAKRTLSFPVAWKRCLVCPANVNDTVRVFKSPRDFAWHLREFHCRKEGGSFVCRYGPHGVCRSLPVEGVSDKDYEDHVARDHVADAASKVTQLTGHSTVPGHRTMSATAANVPVPSSQPSVVEDQHKWTVFMSQVNLPAALNDPRLPRRETDFFTKTWGEGFIDRVDIRPSLHLPEISRDHFKKYMKKTSGRLKEHLKANWPPSSGNSDLPIEEFPMLQRLRQQEKSRAELEAIPKIFMAPNFSLENVDTFNVVFPWTQIEGIYQDKGSRTQQSSKLLQEKLSHYLDLVEVQIARQISLRSEAFFQAMTSHDHLQSRIGNTCKAIQKLRETIKRLAANNVLGPLTIMKNARTRDNYAKLYNKLKLMSTVHQTQPTIQLLLATSEFVGALDLIGTTQEVLTQELSGVHSFRHLGSQLAEMEKVIDKMMQEDFVKYATSDLNRPLSEQDKILEEAACELELNDHQERLVAIVFGMVRQRRFKFVDVYREEACTTLKATIKKCVVEAVAAADDIDTENNVSSLADQMRLLDYKVWMQLLTDVFSSLTVILRRAKLVSGIMLEVAQVAAGVNLGASNPDSDVIVNTSNIITERDTITQSNRTETSKETNGLGMTYRNGDMYEGSGEENSPEQSQTPTPTSVPATQTTPIRLSVSNNDVDVMISEEEYLKLDSHISEMLCAICDHAHDRSVKLLVARSKQGFLERLTSGEFTQLSRSIEAFVSDCEMVCGRRSTSLRASLQSQAYRFVSRFHEERKTKLTLILDNERWKQADVPAEFQHLVLHICNVGKLAVPKTKPDPDTKPQENLSVNGEKYAVVGTVLMLLKMVVEYCQCVDDIPAVTPDLLNRIIELLKMFNSRTCQLILGAGALQLVGLKTITTKNLALASRCLQLVVYFLPMVRSHFTDRLGPKQASMLKHFDSILKDYSDHIAEIANKLVAIMESMLEMQLTKWEVKAPVPSPCFRSIVKQMNKLHEAITDLLPPSQRTELFQRIHDSFKIQLRGQLIRLGVTNDGGPQHALLSSDVAFYTGNLMSLPGCKSLGKDMDSIWDRR